MTTSFTLTCLLASCIYTAAGVPPDRRACFAAAYLVLAVVSLAIEVGLLAWRLLA